MNNKGGKRDGSGRKSIQGKEVKVKIPYETIGKIEESFCGNSLSERIRESIDNSLLNVNHSHKFRVIDLFSGCGGISEGLAMNNRMDIVGGIDFNK